MSSKILIFAVLFCLTPLLAAQEGGEPVVIEESPDYYQECLKNPSAYDDNSASKVFEAVCTSHYYFAMDDQGDFPDPIIKDIVLRSNRSICDRELYGAQMTYLPDFDAFQRPEIFQKKTAEQEVVIIEQPTLEDKRLWLLVTDGLPQQSINHTSVAELIVDPNLQGTFIVGTNSTQGQRRLECELRAN